MFSKTRSLSVVLAHLDLSCNELRAEGAGRLAGVLGECKALVYLDVLIGTEGVSRLAEALG